MNGQRWTEADSDYLQQHYPHESTRLLAENMGRSLDTVWRKARALGLSKTEEYLHSVQSGRIQRGMQHPNMIATRFKPNQVPWNKGVKGSTGLHPNCQKTQFKKGTAPHENSNYKPIGSTRVTLYGIVERKITDDHPVPARRWVAVHRLVWETANGPIPPGHIVVFKPGMRTTDPDDITIDKIECISRAENARRNHPILRAPELAKLYQLKGAITRQLNRIQREANDTSHQ